MQFSSSGGSAVRRWSGVGAQATPTTLLVYKLSVDARNTNALSDPVTGWLTTGGFNEGNATAKSLTDTTMDYRSSFIDTSWSSVTSVNVGMYRNGTEVAYITFSPGTSSANFYSATNVTGSSYTDLGNFGGNFFGINGDPTWNRRWFVEHNYNGCENDTGWLVVEGSDASMPCTWESSRKATSGREFLFSTTGTMENWNQTNGAIGSADVFAVTITYDQTDVPEPPFPTVMARLVRIGANMMGHGA